MATSIFKLVGSIFVDSEEADKSLAKTDSHAEGVASKLAKGAQTAAKWGTAMVGAATTTVAGIAKVAMSTAETCDEIDKMSQKLGMSKEGYQEWSYVLSQAGVDITSMETGMKTLTNKLDDAKNGSSSCAEMFGKLGLSMDELNNMSREEVFEATIKGFQSMEDSTERAALANDLFGKSGQNLTALFNETSESTDELIQKAHDLGMVMSDDAVGAGVDLVDTIDTLKRSFGGIFAQLGSKLVPLVQKVAEHIINNLPRISDLFDKLAPILEQVFETLVPPLSDLCDQLLPVILDLIETLLPIISDIIADILPVFVDLLNMLLPPLVEIMKELLPPILEVIKALMPLLNVIIELLKPILDLIVKLLPPLADVINEAIIPIINLIADALGPTLELLMPIIEGLAFILEKVLGAAFDGIIYTVEGVQAMFEGIIDFITDVFVDGWESAWKGVGDFFGDVFGGLVEMAKTPLNWIIGMINEVIDGINDLEIPDWVPVVGGASLNIPKIPKLAKGGVVESGQMFIANEAGPELVGKFGNNTGVLPSDQIVEAVSIGVAKAVSQVLGNSSINTEAIVKAIESATLVAHITEEEVVDTVVNAGQNYYDRTNRQLYAY